MACCNTVFLRWSPTICEELLRAVRRGLHADTFRPDFMAFNHRGQVMPLDVPPLPKQ